MRLINSLISLIKWLIGAAIFLIVFLLCLIFIPSIFDEILVAVIAISAAIAYPNPFDCE